MKKIIILSLFTLYFVSMGFASGTLIKDSTNEVLFDLTSLSDDFIMYNNKLYEKSYDMRVFSTFDAFTLYGLRIYLKEFIVDGIGSIVSEPTGNLNSYSGRIISMILTDGLLTFKIEGKDTTFSVIDNSKNTLIISSIYLAFANNLSINFDALPCRLGPSIYSDYISYAIDDGFGNYRFKSDQTIYNNGNNITFSSYNGKHYLLYLKTIHVDQQSPQTINTFVVNRIELLQQ